MDEGWLIRLEKTVRERPLVVFQFVGEELRRLRESPRGLSEFTIARSHGTFGNLDPPTACLVFSGNEDGAEARFGLVSSRKRVSTLESRVKVRRSQHVRPSSKAGLLELIPETPDSNRLRERLESDDPVTVLSSGLSAHLVRKLAEYDRNRDPMRHVAESISPSEHHRQHGILAATRGQDCARRVRYVW